MAYTSASPCEGATGGREEELVATSKPESITVGMGMAGTRESKTGVCDDLMESFQEPKMNKNTIQWPVSWFHKAP